MAFTRKERRMRTRQWQAVVLTWLGVLGASAVSAQRDEAPPRRLDPDAITVRLLLGVGDGQTQTWSGKVTLDKGEVLGVEGYRFRKGDRVTGRDSWVAESRLIRKEAAKK